MTYADSRFDRFLNTRYWPAKLIAVFVSLVMVFSMSNLTAFASESDGNFPGGENAQDNGDQSIGGQPPITNGDITNGEFDFSGSAGDGEGNQGEQQEPEDTYVAVPTQLLLHETNYGTNVWWAYNGQPDSLGQLSVQTTAYDEPVSILPMEGMEEQDVEIQLFFGPNNGYLQQPSIQFATTSGAFGSPTDTMDLAEIGSQDGTFEWASVVAAQAAQLGAKYQACFTNDTLKKGAQAESTWDHLTIRGVSNPISVNVEYNTDGGVAFGPDGTTVLDGAFVDNISYGIADLGTASIITVPTAVPQKDGATFQYWRCNETGLTHEPGAQISVDGIWARIVNLAAFENGAAVINLSFDAVYDDTSSSAFYVTYNPNGASTGNMVATQQTDADGKVTIAPCEWTRDKYTFVGWNTEAANNGTLYMPGDTVTLDADLTLYAIWALRDVVTVKYETDGNGFVSSPEETFSALDDEYTVLGATASPKNGFQFEGWYLQTSGTPGSQGEQLVSTSPQLVFGEGEGYVSIDWAANVVYTFTAKFAVNTGSTQVLSANIYYVGTTSLGENATETILNAGGIANTFSQNVPIANPEFLDLGQLTVPEFPGYEATPARVVVGSETYSTLADAVVPNGATVYVYMTPDTSDDAKRTVSYTVNYYFQNYGTSTYTKDSSKTVTEQASVWINEVYTQLPIVEGGIPMPYITGTENGQNVYAFKGYKPADDQSFPEAGTMVFDGTSFDVFYSVDMAQTKPVTLTVKHVVHQAKVDNGTLDVTEQLGDMQLDDQTFTQDVWVNLDPEVFTLEQRADEYVVDVPGYTALPEDMTVQLPEGATLDQEKPISSYLADEVVPSGAVITQNYTANRDTVTSGVTVRYLLDGIEQEDEQVEIYKTKWAGDPDCDIVDITADDNIQKTFRGYQQAGYVAYVNGEQVAFDGTGSLPAGAVINVSYDMDETQTRPTMYVVHHLYDGIQLEEKPYDSDCWIGAAMPYVTIDEAQHALEPIVKEGYFCGIDDIAISPSVEYGQRVFAAEPEEVGAVPTVDIYILYSSVENANVLSYTVMNVIQNDEPDGKDIVVSTMEYNGLYDPNRPEWVQLSEGVAPENEAPLDLSEFGYRYNGMTQYKKGDYVLSGECILYYYEHDVDSDANKHDLSFDINYYGFANQADAASSDYSKATELVDSRTVTNTVWKGMTYNPATQEWVEVIPYSNLTANMLAFDDQYAYTFDRIEVMEESGVVTPVFKYASDDAEGIDLTATYRAYDNAAINVIYKPNMDYTKAGKYTIHYKGLVTTTAGQDPVYIDLVSPRTVEVDGYWLYDENIKVPVNEAVYTDDDTFDFIDNIQYWTLSMTDEQKAQIPEVGDEVADGSEFTLYFAPNGDVDPYLASYTVVHEGTHKGTTTTFDTLERTQQQAFWGLSEGVDVTVTPESLVIDNSSRPTALTYGYEFDGYEYDGMIYPTKESFIAANPTVPEGATIKVLYKTADLLTNVSVTVSYVYGETVYEYDQPEAPEANEPETSLPEGYMPPEVGNDEEEATTPEEPVARPKFVPYGSDSAYPPKVITLSTECHPLDKDAVLFDISDYPEKDLTDEGWAIDSRYYGAVGTASPTTEVPTSIHAGQYVSYNYVKRSDLSYKVQHIDWNNREALDGGILEESTVYGQTFDTLIGENDVPAADIYGYDFDAAKSADTRTLKIGADNSANVVKLYYMPRADLSYVTRCFVQGSEETDSGQGFYRLLQESTTDNQTYMDTVTVYAPPIEGYTVNGAQSKDVEIARVEENGNVVSFYYDLVRDITIDVNYYEVKADGTVVSTPVNENPFKYGPRDFGSTVTIEGSYYMPQLEGFELIFANPATGEEYADKAVIYKVPTNPSPVSFYVKRANDLSYTVKVLDTAGNELVDEITVDGMSYGDKLTAEQVAEAIASQLPEKFENYTFVGGDADKYTIGMGENVFTLTYGKNGELSYAVKYVGPKGNIAETTYVTTIADGDEADARELVVGDEVSFSTDNAPAVIGYNVVSVDKDSITISTDAAKNVVTYTYEPITGIKVKLHNRDFNEQTRVLGDPVVIEGNTFDEAVSFDTKYIKGYTFRVGDGAAKVKLADGTYAPLVMNYENFNGYGTVTIDASNYNADNNCVDVYLYYSLKNNLTYNIAYIVVDEDNPQTKLADLGVGHFENRTHGTKVDIVYNTDSKKFEILENGVSMVPSPCFLPSFEGYSLLKDSNGEVVIPSGMYVMDGSENQIDVSFVKRTDCKYTIRYGKQDANGEFEQLADPVVEENVAYGTVVTAPLKSIPGYAHAGFSTNAPNGSITVGEDPESNVITVYYTLRKDYMYTIHMVDQEGNEFGVHPSKAKYTYGQTVTVTPPDVYLGGSGYSSIEPASQDVVIGKGVDENGQETHLNNVDVYFTAEADKTCYYTVVCVDENGNELGSFVIDNQYYGSQMDVDGSANKALTEELADELNGFKYKTGSYSYVSAHPSSVFGEFYDLDSYKRLIGAAENGKENVLTLVFTPRTDFTYVVHYKDRETDETLADSYNSADYGEAVAFNSTVDIPVANVKGYTPEQASYTMVVDEDGKEFTVYYNPVTGLSLDVRYVLLNDEGDATEIAGSAKTITGLTYKQAVQNSDLVKSFEGYVAQGSVPELESDGSYIVGVTGHGPTDSVSVNQLAFYFAPQDKISYSVQYVDADTNQVVKTDMPGTLHKFGDIVDVQAEVPAGYELVSGEPATKQLEINDVNGGNVATFKVKRSSIYTYTIHFVADGEQIQSDVTVENQTFGATVTSGQAWAAAGAPSTIVTRNEDGTIKAGYRFVDYSVSEFTISTDNAKNQITFNYVPITGLNYTIEYVADLGNGETSTLRSITGTGAYGDVVTETAPATIGGWKLDDDADVRFTLDKDDYVYTVNYVPRNDIEYTVNYVDQHGNELAKPTTAKGTFQQKVTVYPADITGYTPTQTSASITIDLNNNEATFIYYPRTDISYTVNYVDSAGNVLDTQVLEGLTFGEERTFTAPERDGYVTPASQTVKVGIDDLKPFVYNPRTDLMYYVNYLEAGTSYAIANQKVVRGCTYNSAITEYAISINGYTLTTANTTQTIRITTGLNVVNFYYTRDQQNSISGGGVGGSSSSGSGSASNNAGGTTGGSWTTVGGTTGGYTPAGATGGTTTTAGISGAGTTGTTTAAGTTGNAGTVGAGSAANPYNYNTTYYTYTTNPNTTTNDQGLATSGDGYEVAADGVNRTATEIPDRLSTVDRPDNSTYSTRTQTIEDEENPLAAAPVVPGSEKAAAAGGWYWQYTVGALIIAAALAYGIFVFFRRYGSIRKMEDIEDSLL